MEIKELELPTEKGGSFVLGVLGSIIGALVGAAAWCAIAVATEYELGIIAWALGGLAGFGMALGYRRRRAAAGVTAAIIALLGIVCARVMIVGYMGREELSAIRQQLAVLDLPEDRFKHVFWLANRDANRLARSDGRCVFDEFYWEQLYEAGAKYTALPEDALTAAIAEYKEWLRSGRFDDAEYVERALPYYLLEDTELETWYRREPVPPEEWKPLYEEARAQAALLSPDEQSRACRRRAQAVTAARLSATRRSLEQGLPTGDVEGNLHLLKNAYAEALNLEDDALADAFTKAHAWQFEEGQWNTPAWQRLRLTYFYAERAWREREDAAGDVEPLPGAVWDECHRQAAETVAAITGEQLADQIGVAEKELDDEAFAERQRIKDEWKREIASQIIAHAVTTFGVLDLIFLGLAVVTAYRVALSRAEAG